MTELAIVGAGVAGCALAAQLRRQGWSGSINLLEIGRGPGGRAATRRSRRDPALAINHGAPLFNITGSPPPALLAPLRQGDWIQPFTGVIQALDGEGRLIEAHGAGECASECAAEGFHAGALWQGAGGMEQLSRGLLALAAEAVGGSLLRSGTLVRRLEPLPGGEGWQLHGEGDALLLECRWLVLSGTLLAHPRCQAVFGWPEVPLQAAAETLDDAQLLEAAARLAAIDSTASSNLLLSLPAELAAAWLALPWRLLQLSPAAQERYGLRRVSLQPLADGRCAVVAESSPAFAAAHRHVYGSRSSAAQLLGAAPDPAQETATLVALQRALEQVVGLSCTGADAHAQLMRWGAAFPLAAGSGAGTAGLPTDLQLCPASRIGFCGDAIAGSGFGRVEGALRSAEALAARLLPLL